MTTRSAVSILSVPARRGYTPHGHGVPRRVRRGPVRNRRERPWGPAAQGAAPHGHQQRVLRLHPLVLGLLAAALPCWAKPSGEAQVTASLAADHCTIGDLVRYTVEVRAPRGAKVEIPDAEKRLQPFQLRDLKRTEQADGDQLVVRFEYELQVFEVGETGIAGLQVAYTPGGAKQAKKIPAPGVTLTVKSVLGPDARDIKDIRDPVPVRMGRDEWLMAGLLAALLLGLLGVGAWLLTRYLKRRRARPPAPVFVPAHERALAGLDELSAAGLIAAGDLNAYYTRLSEIVREYLEARYGVPAMEETTGMIGRDLEAAGADQGWVMGITTLLRQADGVKFARETVLDSTAQGDLALARELVLQSRMVATPEEEPLTAAAQPCS